MVMSGVSLEVDDLEQALETIRTNGGSDVEARACYTRRPLVTALVRDIKGEASSPDGERLGVR